MSDLYPLPDPMIGQQIGRYVIRRKLAEGGMGAVYVATHERLEDVTKVVKILLPTYARNPVLRDRFEREALAVSRLNHKHIVTIDDYGQLPDGQLFLMMPFLRGRPLDAHLRDRGKFSEHHALHILVQICSALQYMHDAGVVHRDIKPANIFIVEEDDNPYRVYLIDLGIAKSLTERDGVTHAGATMGTPAYMAVEQYEDAGAVTPLADLYAVGILAWELVTARLPWGMHTTHVLYAKQKGERPAQPPEMSAAWFGILSAALAVNPADRPQSMRELAVALASSVPAIPPHVPSGAEILAKLAKTLVDHAPPSALTVRHASGQQHTAPIAWPPRDAPAVPPPNANQPKPDVATRTQHPPADPALSGAVPTTLSASTGSTVPRPLPTGRRRIPIFAGALLSIAGLVTYTLTVRSADKQSSPTATSGSSFASPLASGVPGDANSPPFDAGVVDAMSMDAPTDAPVENALPGPEDEPATHKADPSQNRQTASPEKHQSPSFKPNPRSDRRRGSGSTTFNPNAAGGD